jgi:hypothetical protein
MDAITALLEQYSIESTFLLIILVLIAVKFLGELFDYFRDRVGQRYEEATRAKKDKEEVLEKIEELQKGIIEVKEHLVDLDLKIAEINQEMSIHKKHLIENTRVNFLNAHAKYVYEQKQIDDATLQNLQHLYVSYKEDGGNGFVDQLMKEIESLDRVNPYDKK